ncbi:MAG: hypothetical protein ACD_10C00402G0003 [uncultured bacterium]|nr:MAG: hypothetical protein ACD_10C00402G0003 [uncultured bacterium]
MTHVIAHAPSAVEAGEQVAPLDAAFKNRLKDFQRTRNLIGRLQGKVVG